MDRKTLAMVHTEQIENNVSISVNISNVEILHHLSKELVGADIVFDVWEFLDSKRVELIYNGWDKKYWIIPVTPDILKAIEDTPVDFIKEINGDLEYEKCKDNVKPDRIIKKGGFTYLIKVVKDRVKK